MPYGTMHTLTNEWIKQRATHSGILIAQLGLEPDLDFLECEGHESLSGAIGNVEYCDGSCRSTRDVPDDLHEITVIFGGALDESFYVQTDYEVNIADWIAEQCRHEAEKQDDETWEIIVTRPTFNDSAEDTVIYRVTDES